jgi:GntR family phosphonate transport system transcriptional regulator
MNGVRYLETAEVLASELAGLAPGARIASEHEIAERFGVSRAAARAAVQELERRLLVRRVRGSGTFVSRRIDYVLSRDRVPSWHQTARDAGAEPRSVVRETRLEPLPDEVAERLDRPPGSLAHRLVRQYYLDGLVASWSHEWIPRDIVTELDVALRAVESVDEILRQLGNVRPSRAWCRVSLEVPPSDVVAGLELEGCRPVWLVESVSRDVDSGGVLMCSNTWTRPDLCRMVVELDGRA